MLKIYKAEDGVLVETQKIEPHTWIDASNPSPEELHNLAKYFKLPVETITDPLDVDERARCETDEDYNMIIYRIPTYEENEAKGYRQYFTVPLGIVLVQDCMITLCRRETNIIHNLFKQKNKHMYVKRFPYLILQIFWQTSLTYLSDLKDINTNTSIVQEKLQSSMSNKHLFGMMAQEKTLVYFTTSLRSNDFMLDRLKRMAFFRKGLTEDEEDLLEDVIIENRQALETAKIYNDILTGMMDAFASVINNNVNQILKRFASISIVFAWATLIFSLYGMNSTDLPVAKMNYGFHYIIGFTVITCVVMLVLFWRKKLL
jgi:magnesium transporter